MALVSSINKKLVGFALQDTILAHTPRQSGFVTLNPRFIQDPERSWRFAESVDYAPLEDPSFGTKNAYADFLLTGPGATRWFTRVATGLTDNMPLGDQGDRYEETFNGNVNMISIFANIHVGFAPHPSNPPLARIAILMNSIGAYHWYQTTGSPTPNFAQPRVLNNEQKFQNFAFKGQSWGITNYDDLIELTKCANNGLGIGTDRIRIINLGPNTIHINGLWLFHHGVADRRF